MDIKEEYHDPDYAGTSSSVRDNPETDDEKANKIKQIIRREFNNELDIRENEVKLIEQRVTSARNLLHKLRLSLVTKYYNDFRLQLNPSQIQDEIAAQREQRVQKEVSKLLRDGQRKLHPSLRKHLGKDTVDLDEIFADRGKRTRTKRDYYEMTKPKSKNYTIPEGKTTSLRPESEIPKTPAEPTTSKPKKIPRSLKPKLENVVTLEEATRNKQKQKYRIIIGNTSKYVPPASNCDKSTHKWLLYVRGIDQDHGLEHIVTSVTATLHHSYTPHHIVHLDKPPFHISRRGWGEFPVKLQLNFAMPQINRPTEIEHTIKLDRNYTGLQTLGAETVVDVWLYSNEDMLKYQFKDETDESDDLGNKIDNINTSEHKKLIDNWFEFFNNEESKIDVDEMLIKTENDEKIIKMEELDSQIQEFVCKNDIDNFDIQSIIKKECVSPPPQLNDETDEMNNFVKDEIDVPKDLIKTKKRIMKYMDPVTGKFYYLEMDRKLDLSKVQEIIINNRHGKKTATLSPIKNGVKEKKVEKLNRINIVDEKFKYIENDHCYLGNIFSGTDSESDSVKSVEVLCRDVKKLNSVRNAVYYLLKQIPLISENHYLPFVVKTEKIYWNLDFAKRRNIEWSRAKLINKIISENFPTNEIWRTKQILLFSRLHGYSVVREEGNDIFEEWSQDNEKRSTSTNIVKSLTIFDSSKYENNNINESIEEENEEVEIIKNTPKKMIKTVLPYDSNNEVLQVNSDEKLKFMFIEKNCEEIGIELRNEDIGHGYSYSAVHAVILSAVKSFAEELIRTSMANKVTQNSTSNDPPLPVWTSTDDSVRSRINLQHVQAALSSERLQVFSNRGLGTIPKKEFNL